MTGVRVPRNPLVLLKDTSGTKQELQEVASVAISNKSPMKGSCPMFISLQMRESTSPFLSLLRAFSTELRLVQASEALVATCGILPTPLSPSPSNIVDDFLSFLSSHSEPRQERENLFEGGMRGTLPTDNIYMYENF